MEKVEQEKQSVNQMYYDSPEEIATYEKEIKERTKNMLPKAILASIACLIVFVPIIIWIFESGGIFLGIVLSVIGASVTLGPIQVMLENKNKNPRLKMLEKKVHKFSELIDSGQVTNYPPIEEMFEKDYIKKSYGGENKINKVICRGIENRQFFNAQELESYLFDTFQDGLGYRISDASMKATDNFAVESGLNDYQYVVVTRSTNKDIDEGEYIYSFNKNNDLMLLKPPYVMYQNRRDETKIIYDRDKETKPIIISNDYVKDFQLFGTQLMESSVSSDGILDKKPGLVKTVFSELIFGTAYTIMKNLNRGGISTQHSIKDMRLVQLVLNDKTDIELKGVSIYYEFNRRFGSVKNKEKIESDNINEKSVKKETKSSQSYIEELKQLKEMLDKGIITSEEFEAMKKKILDFEK
jgi:hypothetical protein